VCVVLVRLVTGPLCHRSDTWQLMIDTGTTIVTFLMVFRIQSPQNAASGVRGPEREEPRKRGKRAG
jgi:low affinity Fe/Cu permease